MLGRCAFVLCFVSVEISGLRVGKHFLQGGWERIILTVTPPPPLPFVQTTKRPISAGVQASAEHGDLHSQPASVNNVPNNYVTVFGLLHENVTHPSPPFPSLGYCMQTGETQL